jgi:hypothetical protein
MTKLSGYWQQPYNEGEDEWLLANLECYKHRLGVVTYNPNHYSCFKLCEIGTSLRTISKGSFSQIIKIYSKRFLCCAKCCTVSDSIWEVRHALIEDSKHDSMLYASDVDYAEVATSFGLCIVMALCAPISSLHALIRQEEHQLPCKKLSSHTNLVKKAPFWLNGYLTGLASVCKKVFPDVAHSYLFNPEAQIRTCHA